ncbi:MAG: hypothetical protein MUP98_11760 [Candidatus Aminicenantes bacterium]|nr:hypothetical protein [Candidatus Aminicenantes bacterium]
MSSCIIALYDYPGSAETHPFEEFQRFLPFPPGGTLSLQNGEGNIEIVGWENHECEVYAERRIPISKERRLRILKFDHYIPKINIDSYESFINIQTIPAPGEDASNVVDYFIRVPEAVILKHIINRRGDIVIVDLYGDVYAETSEGNITVDNYSGSLHVSVEIGDVEASLFDLRSEDEIILSSNHGQITLYLQPDVNARLELFAPNGEIVNEFALGSPSPENKNSLEFGEGHAWISITAENGNIILKKNIE